MAVYSSPSIPLDGLVFSIDAGNAKSYSGSGTNVLDIVSGTAETLTNGAGYSSNLSGYFSFDGVDDSIYNNTVIINNNSILYTNYPKRACFCAFHRLTCMLIGFNNLVEYERLAT